jgi:nicotinate-nucleotide adenylyltransferase
MGFGIDNHIKALLKTVDAPLLQISATQIRQFVKSGKSIRYMVPEKVREEIEKYNYYK